MFPAYKPSEITQLPTKYYLAMREYYVGVKRAESRAMSGDDNLGSSGAQVVEYGNTA